MIKIFHCASTCFEKGITIVNDIFDTLAAITGILKDAVVEERDKAKEEALLARKSK